MNVEEIKKAIYELNAEERRELIRSLVPKAVRPTSEDLQRSQAIVERNTAEDNWVSWDDLRAENLL